MISSGSLSRAPTAERCAGCFQTTMAKYSLPTDPFRVDHASRFDEQTRSAGRIWLRGLLPYSPDERPWLSRFAQRRCRLIPPMKSVFQQVDAKLPTVPSCCRSEEHTSELQSL